jgi:DNA-binding transcriptional regulator PaaX
MFDPIFIAKRKREEKYTQARKDLHNAWKLVQYMINREDTRTKRKQVRRDFEKHGMISKELEQEILKELYGIKKVGE